MTANGLTATTTVYAGHGKPGSNNHTSSSSNIGMPTSSSSGSHDNNSPSTSGSGAASSKDNSGTGNSGNPPPSGGDAATGDGGTGTETKAASTIEPPTTTKKTDPCLTSLPPTSCSSTGTSGGGGNQSQNNHNGRHHTGSSLGSSKNTYNPSYKGYKHYDTGPSRHQNSSIGTPGGTGSDSNRTHYGSYGPKTGKGSGDQNGAGPCVDNHFGASGRSCGVGTHCTFIQGHGLFCRHGYVGGENHNFKHDGGTKVVHETEIKVIREPNSGQYNGPNSIVLLSPTSNNFTNTDPTTISVHDVTITSNGVQGWIKGTIKNNSNQTMHELRITGTWYDTGNNTIGMSSGYVEGLDLNPGQIGTFSQFANYDYGRTPCTVELSYDWQ
ncbi:MAG TPA: FxLYD domain-containing protein [Candidatus Nitrosopolaris sp.]|nr:FxLYD domain-containing protein [Candidatus Nitrosopolaris sp.]